MKTLNPVETVLTLAGKTCLFKKITLEQSFYTHHVFQILVDFEVLDTLWMESPTKQIELIGQDVHIEMKHKDGSGQNLFKGIVTNVGITGRHGQQNEILITGKSPTIRLEGKPTMDSFMDKTLEAIVKEAVENSGYACEISVNPNFKSTLDYTAQWEESCYDFLRRLSYTYGEAFYYDGLQTRFGFQEGSTQTIEYDKEMTWFDLSANLIPGSFNNLHYLVHDDRYISENNPGFSSIQGVRSYLQVSAEKSESVYTNKSVTDLQTAVNSKSDLQDLVEVERTREVGEMLVMRGETQTSKVRFGHNVLVKLPQYMKVTKKEVETFLVTKVTHKIDEVGHYSNSFEGIMAGVPVIPMEKPPFPVAISRIATVVKNVDEKEKGRVKVQFEWQKSKGKTTNWIRVQTLDAGGSGAFPKNRGHVFIPEIGDQIMAGFEFGDPSRPFVAGSMFPETKGKGGEADNNIKSIKTRSGHMIEFNDEITGGWGITIKDDSGNEIHLSTKDKSIEITAPETIRLNAKNIDLNAGENIRMTAAEDMIQSAGKNRTESAGETHVTTAKNRNTYVEENMHTEVKKNETKDIHKDMTVLVGDDARIKAGKGVVDVVDEDLFLKATGKITLKSGDIVDIAQG